MRRHFEQIEKDALLMGGLLLVVALALLVWLTGSSSPPVAHPMSQAVAPIPQVNLSAMMSQVIGQTNTNRPVQYIGVVTPFVLNTIGATNYLIQSSTNLRDWRAVTNLSSACYLWLTNYFSNSPPQLWYRVVSQ